MKTPKQDISRLSKKRLLTLLRNSYNEVHEIKTARESALQKRVSEDLVAQIHFIEGRRAQYKHEAASAALRALLARGAKGKEREVVELEERARTLQAHRCETTHTLEVLGRLLKSWTGRELLDIHDQPPGVCVRAGENVLTVG